MKKLFAQLDSLQKRGASLKNILRVIDTVLSLAPNDVDALKCKAVAYIRHEDFEKALQLIQSNPSVGQDLAFEQSYCYYRMGQLEQAQKAVGAVDDDRRLARLQLEAQLHYKLGNYEAASNLYQSLFRDHKVNTEDLQVNTIAAYVCSQRSSELPDLKNQMQLASESSEVDFNLACGLVQQGALSDAEQQLQLALRSGREQLLLEGLDDAMLIEELAPLTAQLAYVHSCLGMMQQASDEYQTLGATDDLDITTAAVVRNNRAVASASAATAGVTGKRGAQDALRRLERIMAPSGTHLEPALESRLLDSQKQEILANRVLLMAAANKQDAARTALSTLQRRFPTYDRLSLLQAALLAIAGKIGAADETLQQAELQTASSGVATQAAFMRAQLAAAHGNRSGALSALCALPNERMRQQPAVVATIAHMQEAERDTAGAASTLEAALEWWAGAMEDDDCSSTGNDRPDQWIMQQLVQARVASGDVDGARKLFGEMGREGISSAQATAQAEALKSLATIIALQGGDIQGLQSCLPPLEPMNAAEVARFETAPAASVMRRPTQEGQDDDMEAQKKRKRKKRKPRYPAGFNPENPGPPPNPERWLPKWQRSEFKKQRKAMERRRAAGREVKGSQGKGLVDESLDVSQQSRPQASTAGPSLPGRAANKTAGRRKGRR